MNKKGFINIFFIFLFLSCSFLESDVYKPFPKGTMLSKTILEKGKQIIIYKNYIILLCDLSNNQEYSEFHLLFFDRNNLKLKNISFINSAYVVSIEEDTIKAYLPVYEYEQKFFYRHDLPNEFKIKYLKWGPIFRTFTQANSLVEGFKFLNNNDLIFYVKKSKEKYLGIGNFNIDSTFLKRFQKRDSIETKLSKVIYSYKDKTISILDIPNNKELFRDVLVVPNEDLFNEFFENITDGKVLN